MIGNLKLNEHITLYDVLVVPEYSVNLIFVYKLTRDSKLFIGFDENKCYFQDLANMTSMGTCSQSDGLYFFNGTSYGNKSHHGNFTCSFSKYTWHHRLGHPADQVLNLLSADLNINNNETFPPCEICHKAKQTREPFPISDHETTNVGDVVHLDVWGPYRIPSRDGFRFFLTIVDDFSRAVWVYLLRNKYEVGDYIISFYNMFSTQFNTNVKIF